MRSTTAERPLSAPGLRHPGLDVAHHRFDLARCYVARHRSGNQAQLVDLRSASRRAARECCGYMWEFGLEKALRDATGDSIYSGTDETQRIRIVSIAGTLVTMEQDHNMRISSASETLQRGAKSVHCE